MNDAASTEDLLGAALAEEREIMDEYASEYRRWTMTGGLVYRIERAAFVRWALRVLEEKGRDPTKLRILDVGCGTGEVLEELGKAGCRRLSGFDLSEAMLAQARRHVPDAQLIAGTLEGHELAPGSVDVVTAAFTVHHLVDPRTFFRTAAQVLAPGGFIFVLEYNSEAAVYSGPTRLATRVLVAPLRFAVRWKNRREIAAQPRLRGRFSSAHRLLGLEEMASLARSSGFTTDVVTHGMLASWFLHDVFETSPFDRSLMRALDRIDASCPPRRRTFQWLAGRTAP